MPEDILFALIGESKFFWWPLAFILIALLYKPQIHIFVFKLLPKFLNRGGKIAAFGASLELNPSQVAENQKATENIAVAHSPSDISLKEFPNLTRTPAIEKIERDLLSNIGKVSQNDQIPLLVRNLAQARLEAFFGITYAGIFGSQIAALIALSARRRVHASEGYEFYKPFGEKFPEVYSHYGFSGWLNFLKNFHLIAQDGEDIIITDAGDDFIKWMRAYP